MTDAQYGEPWTEDIESTTDPGQHHAILRMNTDRMEGFHVSVETEFQNRSGAGNLLERIRACVNFCRGVPSEDLAKASAHFPDDASDRALYVSEMTAHLPEGPSRIAAAMEFVKGVPTEQLQGLTELQRTALCSMIGDCLTESAVRATLEKAPVDGTSEIRTTGISSADLSNVEIVYTPQVEVTP